MAQGGAIARNGAGAIHEFASREAYVAPTAGTEDLEQKWNLIKLSATGVRDFPDIFAAFHAVNTCDCGE